MQIKFYCHKNDHLICVFAWTVFEHAIRHLMLVAIFNIDRLWNSHWWPHEALGVSSSRLYWIQILLNKSKYEFNFKNLNIFHDFRFHSMCCSNVKFLKLEYFNNTSCVNMRMRTRFNMLRTSWDTGWACLVSKKVSRQASNKVMNKKLWTTLCHTRIFNDS